MKLLNKKIFSFILAIISFFITAVHAMALNGQPVPLKKGNYSCWLERLDLSGAIDRTGGNFAQALYNTFLKAVDMTSDAPYLIYPEQAPHHFDEMDGRGYYYIPVACFDGCIADNYTKIIDSWKYARAVFEAFERNHPEVFWLTRSTSADVFFDSITNTTISCMLICTTFITNPSAEVFDMRHLCYQDSTMLKKDIEAQNSYIEEIVQPIANADRYTQVQYLHNWLTHHNSYFAGDWSNTDRRIMFLSDEGLSALKGSTGYNGPVCTGYSRAFKILCDYLNIPCVLVNSAPPFTTMPHAWNSIQMDDGHWYGVDVTWDNPIISNAPSPTSGFETEDFLLVGSQTIIKGRSFAATHPAINRVSNDPDSTCFSNGPILSLEKYKPCL